MVEWVPVRDTREGRVAVVVVGMSVRPANYPRLKLPCGDFGGCKCDRGRPQNFFNLFAVGTEQDSQRICAPYGDTAKAKDFVENIRPGLPDVRARHRRTPWSAGFA